MPRKSNAQFQRDLLRTHLLGAVLTDVRVESSGEIEDGWGDDEALTLVFTKLIDADGKPTQLDIEVGVLSDPEGNGVGWLDLPQEMWDAPRYVDVLTLPFRAWYQNLLAAILSGLPRPAAKRRKSTPKEPPNAGL